MLFVSAAVTIQAICVTESKRSVCKKVFLNNIFILKGILLSRVSIWKDKALLFLVRHNATSDNLQLALPLVAVIVWLYLSPYVRLSAVPTGWKRLGASGWDLETRDPITAPQLNLLLDPQLSLMWSSKYGAQLSLDETPLVGFLGMWGLKAVRQLNQAVRMATQPEIQHTKGPS